MNKRIKNIVTVVLLAAFLFGFGAWAALKPADSLSLSERRRLKQLPAVRMDAVLSGKFMSDFEGYASMALSKHRICSSSESRKEFSRDSTVDMTEAIACSELLSAAPASQRALCSEGSLSMST